MFARINKEVLMIKLYHTEIFALLLLRKFIKFDISSKVIGILVEQLIVLR